MSKSLYEQREEILRVIDMDAWKHSWHLPGVHERGQVDWFSTETHDKIVEILDEKRRRLQERLSWIDAIEIPVPRRQ